MPTLFVRDRSVFYAPNALGKSRRFTPEQFLVCEAVAIARTGEQMYHASELGQTADEPDPIEFDADGRVVVMRTAEEVFSPVTMASMEGKPVTVMHPNEFVTPETWQSLAVGTVQNVRRGEGIEDDLLLADLLITAADAIDYVNRELPEISVGYNARYVPDGPGRALQTEIVGNHVALVERGRAGPRCSIKDSLIHEEPLMKFGDRLKTFFKAVESKDSAAIQAHLDAEVEAPPAAVVATTDAVGLAAIAAQLKTFDERFKALETRLTKDEEEEEEEEKKRKEKEAKDKAAKDASEMSQNEAEEMEATGDTILEAESPGKVMNLGTVYTGDALPHIKATAEIIAPGIVLPTVDALKGTQGRALAAFMRKTLDKALSENESADCVRPFLMGRKTADLKGEQLLGVFNGAAQLARVRNNTRVQISSTQTRDFGKPVDIATIEKANRDFWKRGATAH